MDIAQATVLNLVLATSLANAPFLRLAAVPRWHPACNDFAGWLAGYAVWMALSLLLEDASGKIVDKSWEVWAVTCAWFAVLAFPGLVWRHLLQR